MALVLDATAGGASAKVRRGYRRGLTTYHCASCGAEFSAHASQRHGQRAYCSPACWNAGKVGRPSHNIHHIVPISIDRSLAFAVDNGVVLCRSHHKQVNGIEAAFADFFVGLLNVPLAAPTTRRHARVA